MNNNVFQQSDVRNSKSELSTSIALATVLIFFIVSGLTSYWNTRILNENVIKVTETHEIILGLERLISTMKDAETGQRGYIITGSKTYLEPYYSAQNTYLGQLNALDMATKNSAEQQARMPILKDMIIKRMAILKQNVAKREYESFESARDGVLTGHGKEAMDAIRAHVSEMVAYEKQARKQRFAEMERAKWISVLSGIISSTLGIILSLIIAYLVRRSTSIKQRQQWLQNGEIGLSMAMLGNQRINQLGDNILKFLATYLGAHAGAFFASESDGFKRVSTYGVPSDSQITERFTMGDGLLGQAAKDRKAIQLSDFPEDYLTMGSALGRSKPKHLIILPAQTDNVTNAVIELGFINPIEEGTAEFLEKVAESISVAIRSAHYRENLQNYLEETQRQAEELQAQSEELRVSNEELEEQSRALKESQSRLEQQQAELEQTNSQLEEQTQLLETQKQDLEQAQASIEQKASELEKASQYKSDFLANMSHELRTPLNSSLILAKLLADNPNGNLTEEQVKFAKTIQSSGNDLLALINDILDLSKIEAGHMEIRPEEVTLDRMANDLTRMFEPLAKQKELQFKVKIENGPKQIITDRLRLEQVLKNLISNAIKFTESGKIEVIVSKASNKFISFAVHDTGIGIAPEQQNAVFEAFRQADGTISRKYGGTGLGLSISRELARLLGGSINLESQPGKGSIFTITIPEIYDPNLVIQDTYVQQMTHVVEPEKEEKTEKKKKKYVSPAMQDDRERLSGNSRVILIVEDDISFARIVYDLGHDLGFECLVAHTAEEALILAKQFLPHAVVLDVGLPDNSGLSVLDRLKRDVRTRHIPVHVISANDYTETALSLGAVGYMLKPIKREQLIETLEKLEVKLSQRMRSVLIVEDDLTQQESMQKLLGSHKVETVAVGTASETLEKLKQQNFDCMVLDLTLPDASGYQLLETLSKEDAYSFPPVIVYTGRNLSDDEEQKLRRYSKSIIIKGVKSPERLLDEVTLFLHQVVSELPADKQKMLEKARSRDAALEDRRILVVEDDVANVYALTSILEPRGAKVKIARNGREAIEALEESSKDPSKKIDLVLMDVMMPEVDGLTATREIRKNSKWKKLPIIMLTAKAMRDDQERCINAGANDYMSKPLDVEKLLSLVRVWMPR